MGEGLVSKVVQLLQQAGLRAAPAGPGEPFVSPETPVAAVSILKLEPQKRMGSVKVQLLVPEYLGAFRCEEEATTVGLLLQEAGGRWVQKPWEYRSRESVYCVPLEVEFDGVSTENGWKSEAPQRGLQLVIGGILREYAAGFTTWQENAAGSWNFRLEELYPAGVAEQSLGTGNFDAALTHAGFTEWYMDCVITQCKRIAKADGLQQIWEGTVGSRNA